MVNVHNSTLKEQVTRNFNFPKYGKSWTKYLCRKNYCIGTDKDIKQKSF